MLGSWQVPDEEDIRGPGKLGRIERAAQTEPPVGQLARRLQEEIGERLLPVLGISTQVGQVGFEPRVRSCGSMDVGVHATIERHNFPRSEHIPNFVESLTAVVAEDEIVVPEKGWPEILDRLARREPLEGDPGVEVVKRSQPDG